MTLVEREIPTAGHPTPNPIPRAIVASAVATASAGFTYAYHLSNPARSTDFGQIWFAAHALLAGQNPYQLVGPGRVFEWDWVLYYPATSFVLAIPLSLIPELLASLCFVWTSAFLLGYTITREGWQRLYLLASAAFVLAVGAAQWSPLLAVVLLQPGIAWLVAAKPNIGAAIVASTESIRLLVVGSIGTVILLLISLWFLPQWPLYWLENVRGASHMILLIARPGGFLVLVALLRWRRADARLLVAMACIPQTGSWYETLPLMLAAHSKRECQIISAVSSLGYIASRYLVPLHTEAQINRDMGTLMVWFCYLPVAWLILTRPNDGDAPAWARLPQHCLVWLRSIRKSQRANPA